MNFLLDTQLLLWLSAAPDKLSSQAKSLLEDRANLVFFSPVSILEVAIKRGANRPDFQADPHSLRRELTVNGFPELVLTSEHAAAVLELPRLHKDPFDRLLLAQAITENMMLVTTDGILRQYPSNVLDVR